MTDLKFLPIAVQDLHYWMDKEVSVHVWPPTMLGLTNHSPAARLNGIHVIDEGFFECVGDGHLLIFTHTAATKIKVKPMAV